MHILRAGLVAALTLASLLALPFKFPNLSNAQTVLSPSALIVDDGDAGFALFGPATGWKTAASTPNDYYDGDVTWTTNITGTSPNENYARWSLPVGATLPMTYEVFAFVPRYNSSTQHARYVINSNGSVVERMINQNNYYAEWVSLGVHTFATGTNFIELGDATPEPLYSKRIGFDAIAFVPQQPVTPTPVPTTTATPMPTPTLPFTPTGRTSLPLILRGSRGDVPGPVTPATATTSRYIQTIDPQRHYRMGCEAGERGERGVVILAFGQPWRLDDGFGYGVLIFGALFPANMTQVSDAVWGFIRGYAECLPAGSTGAIQLGLGVNNYKGETNNGHGRAWGGMVNGVHDWLQTSPYKNRVSLFGAADMEPSWNTAANTRAWVDGYVDASTRPLINFGSCDGCPTALNPAQQPNNGWTVEDVWYVSAGAGDTLAVPEIYLRSGIHADQWYRISLHGATQHGRKIDYAGVLTQHAACQDTDPQNCALNGTDNTPDAGLRQLNNAINADARTAFSVTAVSDITWKQDEDTIVARAAQVNRPHVAHRAAGKGFIVEDVQPPLPAHAFIGGNVWVGNAESGEVVQVYAGLVRDWTSEGEASERGGLAIFAMEADGTVALTEIVRAPDAVGALRVVGVEGGVMTLAAGGGRVLRLDLAAGRWRDA